MASVNRIPNRETQKKARPQRNAAKGFKVVAPPKNAERRQLMEGPDITVSGGCRSVGRGNA